MFIYFLVLQGIEDASCAGLKYLLLGAINKCLHHAKEAIQVLPGVIIKAYSLGLLRTSHCTQTTNWLELYLISPLFYFAVFPSSCKGWGGPSEQFLCAAVLLLWTGLCAAEHPRGKFLCDVWEWGWVRSHTVLNLSFFLFQSAGKARMLMLQAKVQYMSKDFFFHLML